jgi:hypothetical protein
MMRLGSFVQAFFIPASSFSSYFIKGRIGIRIGISFRSEIIGGSFGKLLVPAIGIAAADSIYPGLNGGLVPEIRIIFAALFCGPVPFSFIDAHNYFFKG